MARCNSCSGIITKADLHCYMCGEPVPGRAKFSLLRFWAKPTGLADRREIRRITMRDPAPQGNQHTQRTP
ncbi:MAG TPA: hypothetical protein VGG72_33275 [Bryobacteraceae bacterium]